MAVFNPSPLQGFLIDVYKCEYRHAFHLCGTMNSTNEVHVTQIIARALCSLVISEDTKFQNIHDSFINQVVNDVSSHFYDFNLMDVNVQPCDEGYIFSITYAVPNVTHLDGKMVFGPEARGKVIVYRTINPMNV